MPHTLDVGVKPANELDAVLLDLFTNKSPATLDQLRGAVPAIIAPLEAMIQGTGDSNTLLPIARLLAANNLSASALAAFDSVDRLIYEHDYQARGQLLLEKIALERRLNLIIAAMADQRLANRLLGNPKMDDELPLAEAHGFEVIDVWNQPEAFDALAARLPANDLYDDPLRDPGLAKRLFMGDLRPGRPDDLSFFVLSPSGEPLLRVECDVLGARHMGCREAAVVLTPLAPASADMEQAELLAMQQLFLSATHVGSRAVLFETAPDRPPSPALATWLKQHSRGAREITKAWIDLSQDESQIIAAYRENHRRALRWGQKNLSVTTHHTANDDLITAYFALHGGQRKAPLTKEQLEGLVNSGAITAHTGHKDGRPVGLVLASHHGTTTYYMAGVKADDLNKPVTHTLMHHAILSAKAAGQCRFDFGILHTDEKWKPKLRSIALFKTGFTNTTRRAAWNSLQR